MLLNDNCNYIGLFLTFNCNMNCSYCITRFDKLKPVKELPLNDWLSTLSYITTRNDLPITIQGGEPTTYLYFYKLIRGLHAIGKRVDLLTNGKFDVYEFARELNPTMFRARCHAPYASIRFSLHATTDPIELLQKVRFLDVEGFNVGIWGVDHPDCCEQNKRMAELCEWKGIDFRLKEFLGYHNGKLYGTYKYPDAILGNTRSVLCTPSEVLINPAGEVFRCHADLYNRRSSYGFIGDKTLVQSQTVECSNYGLCNPCDVKLKTNRLQEYGHCSVYVEELNEPKDISNMSNDT